MKKLMFMISTTGKSKEQITQEVLVAFRKHKKSENVKYPAGEECRIGDALSFKKDPNNKQD